jgi:hypothetical protein
MSAIDPTGRLLAYLRQQAKDLREKHPAGVGTAAVPQQRKPGGDKDALALATQQILSIDRDNPQSPRKAFRIYLASILGQEFGAAVTDDPGFAALVDRVQETMEADGELRQAMAQAGELLLKAAHAGKAG